MVKTYILDTNVLIQDPDAIYKFEENEIVIPDVVIEELDKLKKGYGEVGYNARKAIKAIEALRLQGNILEGVKLVASSKVHGKKTQYGKLRIETDCKHVSMPEDWDPLKPDNNIIRIAKGIKEQNPSKTVILVSKDAIVRIKATVLGVISQDYQNQIVADEYLDYNGRAEIEIDDSDYEVIESFYKNGEITLSEEETKEYKLIENEYLVVKCGTSTKLGRYTKGKIVALEHENDRPYDITPLNAGQKFALEALLKPASEVPFVILKGPAGTAKTFLSLACGMEDVVNGVGRKRPKYRKILLSRANVQFDNDLGALPGDEFDKVNPLMRGCLDNLEKLIDIESVRRGGERAEQELADKLNEVFERGWVSIEALGYLRGRSIDNTYIIIDEAQNTTPNQMLGILTRAGEDTKIVICGDLDQIDNTKLDRHTNGLAAAIKYMSGSELCHIVGFSNKEATRSKLSAEVARRWNGENLDEEE